MAKAGFPLRSVVSCLCFLRADDSREFFADGSMAMWDSILPVFSVFVHPSPFFPERPILSGLFLSFPVSPGIFKTPGCNRV
ncbi:hypothetical protein [Faecalibaculum rodentium]|uniref:hypothetical protein n=1 Tax=Faecalibaculum rodentium TaxID=1702221 RepID=UPI00259BDDF4|nr:hypothetical protein [Faecalibaculum rodentium]